MRNPRTLENTGIRTLGELDMEAISRLNKLAVLPLMPQRHHMPADLQQRDARGNCLEHFSLEPEDLDDGISHPSPMLFENRDGLFTSPTQVSPSSFPDDEGFVTLHFANGSEMRVSELTPHHIRKAFEMSSDAMAYCGEYDERPKATTFLISLSKAILATDSSKELNNAQFVSRGGGDPCADDL